MAPSVSRERLNVVRISEDVEQQRHCEIDKMLQYLLLLCRDPSGHPQRGISGETLLVHCREALKDVCLDLEVRGHLENYCTCRVESDRYAYLVRAGNRAFEILRKENISGFRDASDLNILFHRNHPQTILSTHQLTESVRKPGVIITSLAAARYTSSDSTISWEEITKNVADCPPKERFDWLDILSCLELRFGHNASFTPRTSSIERAPVPHLFPESIEPEPQLDVIPESPVDSEEELDEFEEIRRPTKRVKISSVDERPCTPAHSSSQPQSDQGTDSSISNDSNPRKRSRHDAELRDSSTAHGKIPANVQCAVYAAEMMSRTHAACHAINLLIRDDVLWVWWFDRQGCIQSQGVNFLEDPSSFFVLLFAFQRFTLADWGLETQLDALPLQVHTTVDRTLPDCQIAVGTRVLTLRESGFQPEYSRLSLLGRGTTMLEAHDEQGTKVALKVIWPERVRIPEGEIIQEARERAGENPHILNHLPEVICSGEFGHDTGDIRRSLGISTAASSDVRSRHPRYLYLIAFDWLYPLTCLLRDKFVRAWLDALRCNILLWPLGVQHGDASLANTMVRRISHKDQDGKKTFTYVGVLNDWDLAYVENSTSGHDQVEVERMGTVPFMALDLLTSEYSQGKKPRRLRHDIEARIWILPWVWAQYRRGKQRNTTLASWNTGDWKICHRMKICYLAMEVHKDFLPAWSGQSPIANALLDWLEMERRKRYDAHAAALDNAHRDVAFGTHPPPFDLELPDEVVIAGFWQQIQDIATRHPHLAYLEEYRPEADTVA